MQLFLFRQADAAWREVVLPWLAAPLDALERRYVVVPTRGQAQGLKQRCLLEHIPLLGVEFLSPGLARKKWLALAAADDATAAKPVLGRELLLLGLRTAIERRLAGLAPDEPAWGFWKSLQSDPERALDDFDDLLKGGFRAEDFPLEPLRDVFGELTEWVERLGYDFAARQSEAAALRALPPGAPQIGGRLLVYGLGPEIWGEFFNVAAFARRFPALTVALPEPVFGGPDALDENWVALWEKFLGVEPVVLPPDATAGAGDAAADLLAHRAAPLSSIEAASPGARIIVGRTRADEMELVAKEVAELLATGATEIGVVFPNADGSHLHLARRLSEKKIPFVDLLESAGTPSLDAQIQRSLVGFYESGATLEALLDLWPLLRAVGQVQLPMAGARLVCERLFDDRQTHALEAYVTQLEASNDKLDREVGRIASALLPPWPAELSLADALNRFEALSARFDVAMPPGWSALRAFAQRDAHALPARVVYAALASFVPAASPPLAARGRAAFARVTLTSRRRAEGLAWSHLIFVEANAGRWPLRRDSTPWLTDAHRQELNRRGRFSLGLYTSDHRAWLERQSYAALARDAREEVVFSAALYDDEEPEIKLAPNSWLERVMLSRCADATIEAAFAALARPGRPAHVPDPSPAFARWFELWRRRRDPARPFDEFFLSHKNPRLRPEVLPVRLIERGAQDPAELWFEAVLKVRRVDWTPLARTRKKGLGLLAHQMMALALRTPAVEEAFGERPQAAPAWERLQAALAGCRARWPRDRYWDSFHAELSATCRLLLEHVFALPAGRYIATELKLPAGAHVRVSAKDRLKVSGRVDLALFDRPGWEGATVNIVDFKTGADAQLSVERMARHGSSLQLGVYLAAAQSLGAVDGNVWMVKPEAGGMTSLGLRELPAALVLLEQVMRQLKTGRYGALTPDRSDYAPDPYGWPLACVPIAEAILAEKFQVTFGSDEAEGKDGDA